MEIGKNHTPQQDPNQKLHSRTKNRKAFYARVILFTSFLDPPTPTKTMDITQIFSDDIRNPKHL